MKYHGATISKRQFPKRYFNRVRRGGSGWDTKIVTRWDVYDCCGKHVGTKRLLREARQGWDQYILGRRVVGFRSQ